LGQAPHAGIQPGGLTAVGLDRLIATNQGVLPVSPRVVKLRHRGRDVSLDAGDFEAGPAVELGRRGREHRDDRAAPIDGELGPIWFSSKSSRPM